MPQGELQQTAVQSGPEHVHRLLRIEGRRHQPGPPGSQPLARLPAAATSPHSRQTCNSNGERMTPLPRRMPGSADHAMADGLQLSETCIRAVTHRLNRSYALLPGHVQSVFTANTFQDLTVCDHGSDSSRPWSSRYQSGGMHRTPNDAQDRTPYAQVPTLERTTGAGAPGSMCVSSAAAPVGVSMVMEASLHRAASTAPSHQPLCSWCPAPHTRWTVRDASRAASRQQDSTVMISAQDEQPRIGLERQSFITARDSAAQTCHADQTRPIEFRVR